MGVWVIIKIKKMENYIGFKKDCFYGKLFVIAIYPHFIFRINNKMIGNFKPNQIDALKTSNPALYSRLLEFKK